MSAQKKNVSILHLLLFAALSKSPQTTYTNALKWHVGRYVWEMSNCFAGTFSAVPTMWADIRSCCKRLLGSNKYRLLPAKRCQYVWRNQGNSPRGMCQYGEKKQLQRFIWWLHVLAGEPCVYDVTSSQKEKSKEWIQRLSLNYVSWEYKESASKNKNHQTFIFFFFLF